MNERKNWIGIRVSDEEKEAIKAMAEIHDVTVSEMIRRSLDQLLGVDNNVR